MKMWKNWDFYTVLVGNGTAAVENILAVPLNVKYIHKGSFEQFYS